MKRGLMSISDHSNNAPRRPFFDTVFHRVVHRAAHGCPQGSRAPAHPLHDRTPVRVCDPNSRSIMKPINSPTSRSPLRRAHITHLGSTPHSLSSMPRCAVRRSEGLMTRARHRGTRHLLRPGARPGRCADGGHTALHACSTHPPRTRHAPAQNLLSTSMNSPRFRAATRPTDLEVLSYRSSFSQHSLRTSNIQNFRRTTGSSEVQVLMEVQNLTSTCRLRGVLDLDGTSKFRVNTGISTSAKASVSMEVEE